MTLSTTFVIGRPSAVESSAIVIWPRRYSVFSARSAMKLSVSPVCSMDCGSGGSAISGAIGPLGVPASGIVGAERVCGWYTVVTSSSPRD